MRRKIACFSLAPSPISELLEQAIKRLDVLSLFTSFLYVANVVLYSNFLSNEVLTWVFLH